MTLTTERKTNITMYNNFYTFCMTRNVLHMLIKHTFNFFYLPLPRNAGGLEIVKVSFELDPFLVKEKQTKTCIVCTYTEIFCYCYLYIY